jgi:hypothetical protein
MIMENEEQLIASLQKDLQLELLPKISFEKLKEKLAAHVDHLINNNFEELINLLYKIDVNEAKLKSLLKEHTDTSNVIADLIIERQLQKIKTRNEFRQTGNENPGEEKW